MAGLGGSMYARLVAARRRGATGGQPDSGRRTGATPSATAPVGVVVGAVVGVVVASLVAALPARAADELALAKVHLDGYPTVVLSVDTPAGSPALAPDEVVVTEDGVPVTATVTRLAGPGLEVVLALDTSAAGGPDALGEAREAATRFIDRLPGDVRVGLVSFGPGVRVLSAPTASRAALGAALAGLTSDGPTPLYDAVVTARSAFSAEARERLLVVFTTAGDDASATTIDDAAAAVTGVQVAVVSLETAATSPLALARLAIEGRGDVLVAPDAGEVGPVFEALAATVLGRYTVTYTSTGHGPVTLGIRTPLGELRSSLDLPPAAPAAVVPPVVAPDPSGPTTAAPVTTTAAPVTTTAAPVTTTAAPVTTTGSATAAPVTVTTAAARDATVLAATADAPNADDAATSPAQPWTAVIGGAIAVFVLGVVIRHVAARLLEVADATPDAASVVASDPEPDAGADPEVWRAPVATEASPSLTDPEVWASR